MQVVQVSMGWALLAGVVLVALAGLVFVWRGWRGRRVGDHPHCRRCGFDLFGSGDAGACPECGADLRGGAAVVMGARRRRPGALVAGLLMLGVALPLLGAVLLDAGASIDLQPYKPVWWLRMEVDGANAARGDAAFAELERRLLAGGLSAGQVDALVDEALRRQADAARPWEPRWGDFVEAVQASGGLDAARWERYVGTAVAGAVSLEVRPRVRRGDEIPYRVKEDKARVGRNTRLYLRLADRGFSVGEVADSRRGGSMGTSLSATGSGWRGSSLRPRPEQVEALVPGRYVATYAGLAEVRASWNETDPVLWSADFSRSDDVEVLPADQPTATPVVDESQRAAVEASLVRATLELRDPWSGGDADRLEGQIEVRTPPVGVAFEVFARTPDGREWRLGTISRAANESTSYGVGEGVEGFPSGVAVVDLVLRPSEAAALGTTDVFEYWGDEVVLKGVPVKDVRKAKP